MDDIKAEERGLGHPPAKEASAARRSPESERGLGHPPAKEASAARCSPESIIGEGTNHFAETLVPVVVEAAVRPGTVRLLGDNGAVAPAPHASARALTPS